MDYRTFLERISDDQNAFEKFCQAALPLCVLDGEAKKNFTSGPKGGPFDGETFGAWHGFNGKILFEYKGGKDRNEIKRDLIDNKLLRAAQDRPDAVAYVLVMGNDRPTTTFEKDIQKFITEPEHHIPFKFLCLPPDVVEAWIQKNPSLLDTVFPFDRTPTLQEFIDNLAAKGAPVSFKNYRNLDNLYVPPREYDRIIEVLRSKRLVFIIGEPHVGKTFTATRIMRHFNVCFGKHPHWLLPKESGREPGPDRISDFLCQKPDSITGLLEGKVGDGKITYIEDIFGRTSDEEVRWDRPRPQDVLYELINYMKDLKDKGRDGMVIVTSREKLFDQALAADPQLNDFIVRLGNESRIRLQLDSYRPEDKTQLLLNYARHHECIWYTGDPEALPADVLQAAQQLQTPHAIFYFCESSRSARTAEERAPHFQNSKQELVTAYMNEIAGFEEFTLAVLLTLHFLDPFIEDLTTAFPRLDSDDVVARWESAEVRLQDRVTIEINWKKYLHPSFEEAVRASFSCVSKCRALSLEMARNVCANHPDLFKRIEAIWILCQNFEILEPEDRVLIRKLGKDPNPEVRTMVAWLLAVSERKLDTEDLALLDLLTSDNVSGVRKAARCRNP